ncbi:MAG: ribonuclease catalytic domain-containing protein [Granulosicoccus sp.]
MASTSKPTPDDIVAQALQTLDIQTQHEKACLLEAQYWLENSGLDDQSLDDCTTLPFVTIDNPDSRDLDQALLIEREAQGFRVRYALADAAYYVRPGSALFKSALSKGTTYYTPTMAAAMLPTELSEGLVSLNPNVDRRALVFDMSVDSLGVVSRSTVVRARINSHAKLNYAGVQAWLDSGVADSEPYHESLRLLQELGNILIFASAQRGVVSFDRTETQISVEGDPPRFEASIRERYDTERYNEQISLLCNMQGAEMLLALSGISDATQAVFRVHDAPLRKNLNKLRTTLDALAELEDQSDLWRWKKDQSLADYVESLPDDKPHRRKVRTVQRQIMQAQRASTFQPDAGEHHALKAASYARFSSPMREIVGIFTHKELLESLGGHPIGNDEADGVLRDAVISSANSAKQRQRQLDKLIEFSALHSVFSRQLASDNPPTLHGTLIGMRRDRLYISLDDLASDIKLYREDIENQFATEYVISEVLATPKNPTKPTWQLGQGVLLRLSAYDKERKRFLFLVDREHNE